MNYNEQKIQIIKDKGLFGNLIEVGCGCPVYAELCNYPNTASKIVNYAFSPNNWDNNQKKYSHPKTDRAISPDVAQRLAEYHVDSFTNFVLSNTIQIANTPDVQTHGWFCLDANSVIKLYHFTINGYRSRKEYIKIIVSIGLDIIASNNNCEELDNGYIDNILIINENFEKSGEKYFYAIQDTLNSLVNGVLNIEHIYNTSIVFSPNKPVDGLYMGTKIERFTTLIRNIKQELIVFKGSFNPIHPLHLHLLDIIKNIKPGVKIVFCISTHNRDSSKKVDVKSLMLRIALLNELGYDVIIDCFGQYHYSYTSIIGNNDYKDFPINYIMGSDVMEKFLEDEHVMTNDAEYINKFNNKWSKATFWWDQRPGFHDIIIPKELEHIKTLGIAPREMSSSNIRHLIINKKFDELLEFITEDLIKLYKKYYG